MKSPVLACAALALTGSLSGCGAKETVTLDVLAASSLTGVYTSLEKTFEADHPGVDVRLSFGSSAALAQQVTEGAPADVLSTADTKTMESAAAVIDAPVVVATNTMVLVVPKDNPAGITTIADLDTGGVSFVTCVESAPCGAIALGLLQTDAVTQPPVSQEADVKAVLAKVTSGEVDAGFVYATDATAAGSAVISLPVPGADAVLNSYPVAAVKASAHQDLAQAWVDLVSGATGTAALKGAGFGPPPA